MGQGVFRCVLIITLLMLIFVFASTGFSYALADAYDILIGNGWTVKDALGFLGTSIAGTIAMNPSLAPAAAAGALSAYILAKGTQLYDIYQEWRNLGMGVAILNPVEYSETMSSKQIANGEYAWSSIYYLHKYDGSRWKVEIQYWEAYNNNGVLESVWSPIWANGTKNDIIRVLNDVWNRINWHDPAGKGILSNVIQIAYGYLVNNTNYTVSHSREILLALESGSNMDSTLGYRVNVDPATISEDGVQYLNDPDAFYNWFVTNYMNGTNQGTFVTPTDEAYDEIRTQLETIINQLNTLASAGGVSEETLNQLKTDIINGITSVMNTSESDILNALDSEFAGLDSTLTSLSNNVNSLQTDINTKFDGLDSAITGVNTNLDALKSDLTSVQTSIDTLSGEINETLQEGLEQEQSFWDGLMEWLDETLFVKLRELLETLFLPTEEQLEDLLDIELPEYQKNFAADVSFSSQSASMPISLFGASVDLSGYIADYASGLRTFMNIFVSGIAAIFVIRAFRVHLNID